MIAAAAANSASSIADKISISWFDAVVVIVLGFGLFRGRRNGMSKEILPVTQWIALVLVCGYFYKPIGQKLADFFYWSKFAGYMTAYIAMALVILLVFSGLKHYFTEKIVKSDIFKGGEYYFGMPVGMIRFAFILMAALALLNAPYYSKEEIAKQKVDAKANFGGGTMSGDFFPSMSDIQQQVFVNSACGSFIKKTFAILLINTGPKTSPTTPAAATP